MNNNEILNIVLTDTDVGTLTIKQFLFKLLTTMWQQGESFSGKRPFGNSGWEFDIYKGLVQADVITGSLDDDGYLDDCDTKQGDKIISELLFWMQEQPYA